MADLPPLVGVDACVLIESVRGRPKRDHTSGALRVHPSSALIRLATTHAFRLLLIDQVRLQVEDDLNEADLAVLETSLAECWIVPFQDPPPEALRDVLEGVEPRLRSAIRHVGDFAIGACVYLAKPDYFVSSNRAHFNQAFGRLLGETKITTPKRFIALVRQGIGRHIREQGGT
ncbi:MAG: hypothetical protein HY320_14060 [Armatimonadetes bacterium]|nr:hypothetical protein [Armatimonadota bacterium]